MFHCVRYVMEKSKMIDKKSKKCSSCQKDLSLENFPPDSKGIAGRHNYCYTCHNIKQREKYQTEKQGNTSWYQQRLKKQRTNFILKTYGITSEQYDRLVEVQNNRCSLCYTEFSDKNKPRLDHNHVTGKLRGMLCNTCNLGLGLIENTPNFYQRVMRYLSLEADKFYTFTHWFIAFLLSRPTANIDIKITQGRIDTVSVTYSDGKGFDVDLSDKFLSKSLSRLNGKQENGYGREKEERIYDTTPPPL